MNKKTLAICILYTLLFSFISNSYILLTHNIKLIFFILPAFLLLNIFGGMFLIPSKATRLKYTYHGAVLLTVFANSAAISVIYHIILTILLLPYSVLNLIFSMVFCIIAEVVLFWNGIICVYLTSVQLGIKQRLIGALCGMIPIVNLIVLRSIIKTVFAEVFFEYEKIQLNQKRAYQNMCETKYPLLLVHGVFFRDSDFFNYWGRIPKELEQNGATIYYGNHQSAASIADSAAELTERIKEIVAETGCEKVNIIAHSKGGLDCRYAISFLDAAPFIASLTTVNTPHRGCLFADYLLTKIPEKVKTEVATAYNTALKKFGDKNPDFLSAVNNLTDSYCQKLDSEMNADKNIYCQSIGSVMPNAASGKFPLNFSYHIAKYFDGANDGLVSTNSFEWGEKYTLLTPTGKRGISHGDIIDLNRENIEGFDVREFYVELVNSLKNKGL